MLHKIFEYLVNLHLPFLVFITLEAGIAWSGFFMGGLVGSFIGQWRSKRRLKKTLNNIRNSRAAAAMILKAEIEAQENLENSFREFYETAIFEGWAGCRSSQGTVTVGGISTPPQSEHWIKR